MTRGRDGAANKADTDKDTSEETQKGHSGKRLANDGGARPGLEVGSEAAPCEASDKVR